MIQELAQQEGLEAPDTRMLHDGATAEVGEPVSPNSLSRDLPSSDPQLGKRILTCWILSFSLLPLTFNVVVYREHYNSSSRGPAVSIGAEDSTVQTSAGEPSVVEFAVTSVAVEAATTIIVPKVLTTTSVSDEPVVGLTSAQVELVLISRSVMERGSGSTSAGLSPAMTSWKS